jgi:hypothetical protein
MARAHARMTAPPETALLHHPATCVVGDECEQRASRVRGVLLVLGALLHLRHVLCDPLLHVGRELADHVLVSALHERSGLTVRAGCDVEDCRLLARRQRGIEFCSESFTVGFLCDRLLPEEIDEDGAVRWA